MMRNIYFRYRNKCGYDIDGDIKQVHNIWISWRNKARSPKRILVDSCRGLKKLDISLVFVFITPLTNSARGFQFGNLFLSFILRTKKQDYLLRN